MAGGGFVSGMRGLYPHRAAGNSGVMGAVEKRVSGEQKTELLVCAATAMELRAFAPALNNEDPQDSLVRQGDTLLLVTGVGIPLALATVLQTCLREKPGRILNLGIAGAYPGSGLSIGDVVLGESEVYGDVGLELPEAPDFQPLRETVWGQFYSQPFPLSQDSLWAGARVVPGCTVNACTGTDETGRRRERQFGAAFETMEGAAVAQIGDTLGIPVSEVRAISNLAAHRDMRPENIRLALHNLEDYLRHCRETYFA